MLLPRKKFENGEIGRAQLRGKALGRRLRDRKFESSRPLQSYLSRLQGLSSDGQSVPFTGKGRKPPTSRPCQKSSLLLGPVSPFLNKRICNNRSYAIENLKLVLWGWGSTRSHSEHGSQAHYHRWYLVYQEEQVGANFKFLIQNKRPRLISVFYFES